MTKTKTIFSWVFRLVAALILLQSAYFKLVGDPESIEVFNQVGLSETMRMGTGIVELLAAILLLIPRTIWLGAVLTMGIVTCAIMCHFCFLGMEFQNDSGIRFGMGIAVFLATVATLWIHRNEIPFFDNWGPEI